MENLPSRKPRRGAFIRSAGFVRFDMLFNFEGSERKLQRVGDREEENLALAHGGVAQLGEHLPCTQGVRGSSPLISTMGRTKVSDRCSAEDGLIAQLVRARA